MQFNEFDYDFVQSAVFAAGEDGLRQEFQTAVLKFKVS